MAHLTLQDYHTGITDAWKMFKAVRNGEIDLTAAIQESDRIVKAAEGNQMIKDIIFAIWNEIDREALKHQQMSMNDLMYGKEAKQE